MTDNLPAIRQDEPSREVATTDTDSWINVVGSIAGLAEKIAGTEFVPKGLRDSVPATAAAILYGREVGLPPMTALTQTHVIEGKPSISAEGMRAMVFAAGHQLEFLETTGAVCRMRARRAGSERWTELVWSIDMARAANLTGKSNWKSYPRAMLIARCTGDLVRMVFPDVIHGFRTLEEMEDVASPDGEPAPATQSATRRVSRARKKAALPAAGAPVESQQRPERPTGPPLPGEDGYDAASRATEQVGEVSDDSGQAVDPGEEPGASPTDESPQGEVAPEELDASVSSESTGPGVAPPATPHPAEPNPADDAKASPRPVSKAQVRMIQSQFSRLGMKGEESRDARLAATSRIIDRSVESTNDLFTHEAHAVIDTLARCETPDALGAVLDAADPQDES